MYKNRLSVALLIACLVLGAGVVVAQEPIPLPPSADGSQVETGTGARSGAPGAFTLITSNHSALARPATITLQWNRSDNATRYRVVVRRHDRTVIEKALVQSATACNTTLCSYTLSKPLRRIAEYDWRIIALNDAGRHASERRFFSVQHASALELLNLVNLARCNVGLVPLVLNGRLSEAANRHSVSMAKHNFFSHTGRNGSSFSDRIRATGYPFAGGGENIAAGNSTANATFQQWWNSTGHRNNILNANHREMGIGYAHNAGATYRHYWTQKLATRSGAPSGTCP